MPRPNAPRIALAATALTLLAYVVFFLSREGLPQPRAGSSLPSKPAPQLVTSAPLRVAALPPPVRSPPKRTPRNEGMDEVALMAELRDLRVRAPEQALERARQANAADPNSPGAAERTWLIVRALEDLRRFSEARDVAIAMRDRYPGTPWTTDVERHVLVYPLGHPSREAQQAALQPAPTAP